MAETNYTFSKICAWGLVCAAAAMGLVGVLAMFTPDGAFMGLDRTAWCVIAFALVTAFAILQINTMSDAAMHAISREGGWHWPTLIPAALCVVIFAVASNVGVHLGWEVLRASAAHPEHLPSTVTIDAVFLVLSIAKPLPMLAIAGRLAMDRADAEARQTADQSRVDLIAASHAALLHEEKLAQIEASARASNGVQPANASAARAAEPPLAACTAQGGAQGRPPHGGRPRLVKTIERAGRAAAVGLTVLGSAHGAAAAEAEPVGQARTMSLAEAQALRGPVTDGMRAEARRRLAAGEKVRAVSDQTGVPLSTCKRYAAERRVLA